MHRHTVARGVRHCETIGSNFVSQWRAKVGLGWGCKTINSIMGWTGVKDSVIMYVMLSIVKPASAAKSAKVEK